ncbi:pyruvate dehydrogenase [acetyl-transferring]-phosphatase 1, mitochondrial [Dermacentor albipictus]|uniref:pyruvate dehydrogenase [acetyl-transferring]-phosphatase 1, mitochondrial n=1 Tax=Dermacentor albipictus TaxID=60249 RepID=UPI0038FC3378
MATTLTGLRHLALPRLRRIAPALCLTVPKQQSRPRSDLFGAPRLGPPEVSKILRSNETSREVQARSLRSFDTNQLASNSPMEDRLVIARCLLTTGHLFGVFDGHGGPGFAQLASQRLFDYIALSVLPHSLLKEYIEQNNRTHLVQVMHCIDSLTDEQNQAHFDSLYAFARKLLSSVGRPFSMQDALHQAFLQLDADISCEVTEQKWQDSLRYALMGACACVVHVDGLHLHVASAGDCRAVLGSLTEDSSWRAKPLSLEHNTDNIAELRRVLSEHPESENNTVVRQDRLLGQLAPLRALGDYNYKWPVSQVTKLLVPLAGPHALPHNYCTPPYLSGAPEVTHHHLGPHDKFLVLATDGLWEQLQPHRVAKLVGQHMSGRQTLDRLRLPQPNMRLIQVARILAARQKDLAQKPTDANAATHLIRNALGRTEYGIEHSKLAAMLALPQEVVRSFRDDITVVVIYFDSDFLRLSPAG